MNRPNTTYVASAMGPKVESLVSETKKCIASVDGQLDGEPCRIDDHAWQVRFCVPDEVEVAPLFHMIDLKEGQDLVVQQVPRPTGRRLVVLDMDSTLIQAEVIDELARAHGVLDAVSEMTRRAMDGELDYIESLRARVGLLRGLPFKRAEEIANELPVTEGAADLLSALRNQGHHTALISGGFLFAANFLKQELGLHEAYANHLVVEEGLLTGEVDQQIICPDQKAELLLKIAAREGIPQENTVAVGDGANDLKMLSSAGLGIAFHAKDAVAAKADLCVRHQGLHRVLLLMNLSAK